MWGWREMLSSIFFFLFPFFRCFLLLSYTRIDHQKFKPRWPTSGRDFVNVARWQKFPDGSVALAAQSVTVRFAALKDKQNV
jgi:hypothetical protein